MENSAPLWAANRNCWVIRDQRTDDTVARVEHMTWVNPAKYAFLLVHRFRSTTPFINKLWATVLYHGAFE